MKRKMIRLVAAFLATICLFLSGCAVTDAPKKRRKRKCLLSAAIFIRRIFIWTMTATCRNRCGDCQRGLPQTRSDAGIQADILAEQGRLPERWDCGLPVWQLFNERTGRELRMGGTVYVQPAGGWFVHIPSVNRLLKKVGIYGE